MYIHRTIKSVYTYFQLNKIFVIFVHNIDTVFIRYGFNYRFRVFMCLTRSKLQVCELVIDHVRTFYDIYY